MTNLTKLSTLALGAALLTLTAVSTVAFAHPKEQQAEKHQEMDGKHKEMDGEHHKMDGKHKEKMEKMKMDMSKVDMSKLSSECQTMMGKMKAKMAEKHGDGDMKDHDMSKMKDHDKGSMKDHGSEEMKAKMATHKKCRAEMKAAMPQEH